MKAIKQVGTLGLANGLFLLCQFGVLALLARFTDVATVAAFGFSMAVIQPVYQLALMGLRANLATDALGEHDYPAFLSVRLIMTVLMAGTLLLFFLFVRPQYLMFALPLVISKISEMQANLTYGAMQRAGRVNAVAVSMGLRGPISLAIFAVVLIATREAQLALWVQAIVSVSILMAYDTPTVRRLGEKIALERDWAKVWNLARSAAPLGFSGFFASLQVSVPRIIVEAVMSETALAVLSVVAYVQQAVIALFQSVDAAVSWRLSRIWAAGEEARFHRLVNKMLVVAAGLGIAGLLFALAAGKPMLTIALGEEYGMGAPLLNWIALAIGLRLIGNVLQTGLIAQRRFGVIGKMQLVLLLLAAPATLIGIRYAGLVGVGMGIAALMLLRAIMSYGALRLQRPPDAADDAIGERPLAGD